MKIKYLFVLLGLGGCAASTEAPYVGDRETITCAGSCTRTLERDVAVFLDATDAADTLIADDGTTRMQLTLFGAAITRHAGAFKVSVPPGEGSFDAHRLDLVLTPNPQTTITFHGTR